MYNKRIHADKYLLSKVVNHCVYQGSVNLFKS